MDQPSGVTLQHRLRVLRELRLAGITWWASQHAVVSHLAELIHSSEHVAGIVYGYRNATFTLLAVTDRRVLLLTHAFMQFKEDELSYDVVSGVTIEDHLVGVTFTLHTRIGDFSIRTYNSTAALHCRDYLEQRCLENSATSPSLESSLPPRRPHVIYQTPHSESAKHT